MRITPATGSGQGAAVISTVVALATGLEANRDYLFASSTNCYIRQGTAYLVTCATKANMADSDYVTVTLGGVAVLYEYDKTANGVTAGRTSWAAGAGTAAQAAATLKTAINLAQPTLRVTDHTDGTLTIEIADSRDLTVTESVVHASFTVGAGVMQASSAAGSALIPAGYGLTLKGSGGGQVGVIRVSADGAAGVTRVGVE